MTPEQDEMMSLLEALEKQATPGPWEGSEDRHLERLDIYSPGNLIGEWRWLITEEQGVSDRDFIIAARNDLPSLLSLVREQARALERVTQERDSARNMVSKTYNALRDQMEEMEEELKDYDW